MDVVNAYMFGSRVYRSHDSESDNDYVIITREPAEAKTINEKVYTIDSFQALLDHHDVTALECYFLPSPFIIKNDHQFNFTLSLGRLRTSISTVASHSFVKGKKKITVTSDYDLRAGIKSVFHSLRILGFGIQLATNGVIYDYSESNWILEDLWKLSRQYERIALWEAISTKYKPVYNKLSSQFKALAPKDKEEINKRKAFKEVLNRYDISPYEVGVIVEELMSIC